MKKIFLSLLSIALLFQEAQACDQVFYGQLRAGGVYTFWDDLTNATVNPVFVNAVQTTFMPQYVYGVTPTFSESSLVANSHIWVPGETGRVVNSSNYTIGAHPPVRSQDNLAIVYDVTYSEQVNGNWGVGRNHRECKYYEITWCGDGILDSGAGEVCDDGVQNGQPGKCSLSCNGTIPSDPPVCNSIVTGTQPDNPLARNPLPQLCTAGIAANGNTVGTTANWTCSLGTQSVICSANWSTTPPPSSPVCEPSRI